MYQFRMQSFYPKWADYVMVAMTFLLFLQWLLDYAFVEYYVLMVMILLLLLFQFRYLWSTILECCDRNYHVPSIRNEKKKNDINKCT